MEREIRQPAFDPCRRRIEANGRRGNAGGGSGGVMAGEGGGAVLAGK